MRRVLTFWVPVAIALPAACGSPMGAGGPHPISGKLEALTPPTMTVSGRIVTTSGSTVITKSGTRLTMTDLRVGEALRVEGREHGDSLDADSIEVEDDGIEFRGTVDSLAAPKLFVSGHVVVTDSGTKIERDDQRVPFDSLQAGDTVKVEGQLQADSSVLATEIEVRHGESHDGEQEDDSTDAEVEGTVDSLAPPDLFVAGRLIVTDSSTVVIHDGDHLALADLKASQQVEVKGVLENGGAIRAREIEIKD